MLTGLDIAQEHFVSQEYIAEADLDVSTWPALWAMAVWRQDSTPPRWWHSRRSGYALYPVCIIWQYQWASPASGWLAASALLV